MTINNIFFFLDLYAAVVKIWCLQQLASVLSISKELQNCFWYSEQMSPTTVEKKKKKHSLPYKQI